MLTHLFLYFLLQGPQGPPGGVGPMGSVGEKVSIIAPHCTPRCSACQAWCWAVGLKYCRPTSSSPLSLLPPSVYSFHMAGLFVWVSAVTLLMSILQHFQQDSSILQPFGRRLQYKYLMLYHGCWNDSVIWNMKGHKHFKRALGKQ